MAVIENAIEKMSSDGPCSELRYQLCDHVFACRTADYVVLLDARTGRYMGVAASVDHGLRRMVADWPGDIEGGSWKYSMSESAETEETLNEMLRRRILRARRGADIPRKSKVTLPQPSQQLIEGYEAVDVPLRVADVMHFAWSVVTATRLLRLQTIAALMARAQNRRAAQMSCHEGSVASDPGAARVAVAQFDRLFQMSFSNSGKCLFRSVALSEYLFLKGLLVKCVIGVATSPFGAHCWLQEGVILINDEPGHVNNYTPILVI